MAEDTPTTPPTPDASQFPVEDAYQPEEANIVQEDVGGVAWTASEYVAHHKSVEWYATLACVALIIASLVWLFTKDKISAAVVLVGAAFLGGYGARQPRELPYSLDGQGLTIGNKYYPLASFRSFSVNNTQAIPNITLLPLKRFGAPLSIYYEQETEPAILNLLAAYLPVEEHREDAVDRLMRHIRF